MSERATTLKFRSPRFFHFTKAFSGGRKRPTPAPYSTLDVVRV